MSIMVKMVSGENLPDDDTRKTYLLKTEVTDVEFAREQRAGNRTEPYCWIWFKGEDEPQKFYLSGNVYVMNEAGKTISSFGVGDPYEGTQPGLVREIGAIIGPRYNEQARDLVNDRG